MQEQKSVNYIIGQYVERKDIVGLADYFRAYRIDEEENVSSLLLQERQKIVQKIEKLKNKYKGDGLVGRREFIYEEALSDVISSLKGEGEK
jgi:hypothetical protein